MSRLATSRIIRAANTPTEAPIYVQPRFLSYHSIIGFPERMGMNINLRPRKTVRTSKTDLPFIVIT